MMFVMCPKQGDVCDVS